jgi:hypothetical protein
MLAEKYVVQNGQNGGSSRGIFMWKKNNTDWGMYMASAGTGKSLNGGTAVAGHNFDSHAIRFRVKGDSDRGFIWENSSNQRLMSLNGSSGDMKLKGTLDVGGLTVNGEAIGGTSNNPIDDVLKYQASPDMIIANRDTKFTEDVIVDGDLTLTGPSFNWEANGGTPGVQFAKSDDKLSFNLKWTSKSNYRSYLNITNEYKKSDFPQHIQDIGVDIKANILAPGLMVKDFVMIGAQTQFTKIDNAVLQVDGRVYISETGGSEHGIGDTASINYQDYLLWVEEGVVSVDFALAELADWPDYVFEENYPLQSLNDVEMFIKKNGHLPTMPTAEDVKQNGFSVGKMTINVVKTIEELTLHTIAQEKQIATLMDRLVRLEQMLETKGK